MFDREEALSNLAESSRPVDCALIERLLARHAAPLELYARGFCDGAEDVVQEAFFQLAQLEHCPVDPVAWLYRVVRYRAIDALRKGQRRNHHEMAAGNGTRHVVRLEPRGLTRWSRSHCGAGRFAERYTRSDRGARLGWTQFQTNRCPDRRQRQHRPPPLCRWPGDLAKENGNDMVRARHNPKIKKLEAELALLAPMPSGVDVASILEAAQRNEHRPSSPAESVSWTSVSWIIAACVSLAVATITLMTPFPFADQCTRDSVALVSLFNSLPAEQGSAIVPSALRSPRTKSGPNERQSRRPPSLIQQRSLALAEFQRPARRK